MIRYLWTLGFGNDAAGLWEIADLLRTSCQTVNNSVHTLASFVRCRHEGFEGGLSQCRSSGPSFREFE